MTPLLLALPWMALLAYVLLVVRLPRELPAAAAPRTPRPPPLVSVIVPARNEALNIEACVRSLTACEYPDFEVIVVDDASDDGTGALARAVGAGRARRLEVVVGAPLPTGWLGKPWACQQGFEVAEGALLLFTDADTTHGPQLLPRAVAALEEEGADLLTVVGRQLMDTFWERLVQPQIFFMMFFRFPRVEQAARNDRWRDALANGQFMLFRREAYERSGARGRPGRDRRGPRARSTRQTRGPRPAHPERRDGPLDAHVPLAPRARGRMVEEHRPGRPADPTRWVRPATPPLMLLTGVALWVAPPVALALALSGVSEGGCSCGPWRSTRRARSSGRSSRCRWARRRTTARSTLWGRSSARTSSCDRGRAGGTSPGRGAATTFRRRASGREGDVTAYDVAEGVRQKAAHELGFSVVGITPARASDHTAFYRRWIAEGRHGQMAYLARADAVARRAELELTMPEVRSCVVVAHEYLQEDPPGVPDDPSRAVIARYARGDDYHEVVKAKLEELLAWLDGHVGGGVRGRAYVDTGPVLERELARRAGLGWFGRNTMLINPARGSYFFLGVLLVDADLPETPPFEEDRCGTCRACLDACPTGALLGGTRTGAPVIDARRCISYLTIELKEAHPARPSPCHRQPGLRMRHLPGGVPLERALRAPGRGPRLRGASRDRLRLRSSSSPPGCWRPTRRAFAECSDARRYAGRGVPVCSATCAWRSGTGAHPRPSPRSSGRSRTSPRSCGGTRPGRWAGSRRRSRAPRWRRRPARRPTPTVSEEIAAALSPGR
jgi:epoxyqueuosine reductase QueG